MGKIKKSTRKFQKKLPQTLATRKQHQLKAKSRQQRGRGPSAAEEESGVASAFALSAAGSENGDDALQQQNVEEFMDSGFLRAMEEQDAEDDSEEDEESDEAKESEESSIAAHKRDLEKLKETDPEFYAFLQQEDKELLQFGTGEEDEDEAEEEEEDQGEEEAADTGKPAKKASTGGAGVGTTLTAEMTEQWGKAALEGSLPATKRLVVAFKVACHTNDADGEAAENEVHQAINIADSDAFNGLVLFCLKSMPLIFDKLLLYKRPSAEDASASTPPVLPNRSSSWKRVERAVNSYLQNLLHFLQQLTDPKMVAFVLKHSIPMVPYIASISKYANKYLKAFLQQWSRAEEETARILAFLAIHKMATMVPYPFINSCLKGVYLTFVRNAKFVNAKNISHIQFMMNSIVELYALDERAAYQHAFVYIRQLAIHLRNAMSIKSKDASQSVYNWQYINSLRVWSKVLSRGGGQGELQHLIYPWTQVTLGVIRLLPTPRYYPLRFLCIRSLNELAAATNTFICPLPYLLEVLDNPDFKKKAKPSDMKPIHFQSALKVGPKALHTSVYTKGVFDELMELLLETTAIYSRNIAFPEIILPAITALKKFQKSCKNVSFSKEIAQFIEKVEENANFIQKRRDKIEYSPFELATKVTADAALGTISTTPLEALKVLREGLYRKRNESLRAAAASHSDEEEDIEEDDEEEEEEEEGHDKKKAQRGQGKLQQKKQHRAPMAVAGSEDVVEELVLSESDSDS
ncbi:Nucleolar Complex 2 protein [Balamuthia mandrillaris]